MPHALVARYWLVDTRVVVEVVPPGLVVVLRRRSLEECPCADTLVSVEVGRKVDVEGLILSLSSSGLTMVISSSRSDKSISKSISETST